MTIETRSENRQYTLIVSGRLDTTTAPQLELRLKECFDDMDALVFDFTDLEYLSSAGLRVLLASHKKLRAAGGSMMIMNINETVRDIFAVTGMDNIFTIEGNA